MTYLFIQLGRKHVAELIQCQQSLGIQSLKSLMLQGELLKLFQRLVRSRPVRQGGEAVHTQVYEDDIPSLKDNVNVDHCLFHTLGNMSRGREGW